MKTPLRFFVLLVFSMLVSCNNPVNKSSSETPAVTDTSKPDMEIPSPDSTSNEAVTKPENLNQNLLIGSWLRIDGGYELEILNTYADGKLRAGYYNPNPVNVGKAEWLVNNNTLFMMVELQDINYPGSTYTLEYLPADDRLIGNYFQATQGVNYDVEFVRKK